MGEAAEPLAEVLRRLAERGKLAVVCLGNELRGDDVAGLVVCRELAASCRDVLRAVELVEAGLDASRVLGLVLSGYAVLVVDAVVAEGSTPGEVLLLENLEALKGSEFAITTHTLSLSDFRSVLEGRVALLGIAVDPKNMELGAEPSPQIIETSKAVADLLCSTLRERLGAVNDTHAPL